MTNEEIKETIRVVKMATEKLKQQDQQIEELESIVRNAGYVIDIVIDKIDKERPSTIRYFELLKSYQQKYPKP